MSLLRVHRSYCAIARKNRDLVASIGKYDTVEIDFGKDPRRIAIQQSRSYDQRVFDLIFVRWRRKTIFQDPFSFR